MPNSQQKDSNLVNRQVHPRIVQLLNDCGLSNSKQGHCFGIANMAMQAILCDDLQQLRARFHLIDNLEKYVIDDKTKIDLDAFLQGIILYHSPSNFPEIFQKSDIRQNTLETAPLIQSKVLEEKGGVASIISNEQDIIGIYNIQELELYFFTLENLLIANKEQFKENFVLNIQSSNHSIIVSFDHDKGEWILVDAHPHIPRAKTHQEIAKNVYHALSRNHSHTSKHLVIYTRAFTVNKADNIACYQNIFEQWFEQIKPLNEITEEKAQMIDLSGSTLLTCAVHAGRIDLIAQLLEHGADAKQMTPEGSTVLLVAIFNQRLDIVKLLLSKGSDLSETNKSGKTPLHIAVETGNVEIFDFLLAHGANVNQTSNNGTTALILAAQYGHSYMLKRLLELEADPKQSNDIGILPLHSAAKHNHQECITILLNYRAEVNQGGLNDGTTALVIAAQSGAVEASALLIANGADVNRACEQGVTPLIVASETGQLKIVKLLLEHNADPSITTKNGLSPLYLASRGGYEQIIDVLMQNGADADFCTANGCRALIIASENGHSESVKTLLARGAKVNLSKKDGTTALMAAVFANNIEIVRQLVAHGENVNKACQDGSNPLIQAAIDGHLEVVNFLLEAGANPLQTWKTTKPAIQQIFSNEPLSIIFRILQFMAKFPSDELSISPLDLAHIFDHKEVAEKLEQAIACKKEKSPETFTFFNQQNNGNTRNLRETDPAPLPTQEDESSLAAASC